jgi:hypothetical protein
LVHEVICPRSKHTLSYAKLSRLRPPSPHEAIRVAAGSQNRRSVRSGFTR